MFPFFSKSEGILGLDIGFETLKVIELKKSGNGASLVGAINFPLQNRILEKDHFKNKEETAKLLQQVCLQAKPSPIRAKKIVSALPETFVFAKTIQMPKMAEDEYSQALPAEAAQHLPLPIEEVYIDHQVLIVHPDEPLVDLLFIATPKKLVDDYVELARLAGMELIALEPKTQSVGRAMLRIKSEGAKKGFIIAEIGTEITRISIWEDGKVRLTTSVAIGKNQIIQRAAGTPAGNQIFSAQHIAAITEGIIQAIRYHQNRDYQPKPIEKVLLCGTGASFPGIDALINQKIGIQTEVIKPSLSGKDQLGTEFITAYGLALREEYE